MGSLILPTIQNLDEKTITLNMVLQSRVLTGFLRAYADSQYSSENLAFIQAEQNFREGFAAFQRKGTTKEEVMKVYNYFLDDEKAEMQICLTSDEAASIKQLVESGKYSEDMFTKLLANPELTVKRDIFPRFLQSEFFKDMKACLEKPCKDYLQEMKVPIKSLMESENPPNLDDESLRFSFDQVLSDGILSRVLLEYLKSMHCAENLECCKAIQLYKERHGCADVNPDESRDRAFFIYFTFLQPGTNKEVSVESHLRHHIGQQLASPLPPQDLFDKLENTLRKHIRQNNWPLFQKTDTYLQLRHILRKALESRSDNNRTSTTCCIQ